jgi:hypothetical protein
VSSRPAADGGRWVVVEPERLAGFLDRFAARHGELRWIADADDVTVTATDGAVAACRVPFPPLRFDANAPFSGLIAHAGHERRVGVLLVRLGGHAAGVFEGTRLVGSKVGARYVQSRTAAGGWSQRRFARRRSGQRRVAMQAAADDAARVLLPVIEGLAAVVVGGDRAACDSVLADPRLAPLRPLVLAHRLDVPDPRLKVLQATPPAFRAVHVRIVEPSA